MPHGLRPGPTHAMLSRHAFGRSITMQIGRGQFTYEWHDHWARIPDTESGRQNGRTHGVVATAAGDVCVFNQADPGVLVFGRDGQVKASWGDRFGGAHGMTLVREGDVEYLWLTDERSHEVVKTTLDGTTVQTLPEPDHDAYRDGGRYVPTWVAVNEEGRGGNGDVWVADGYGSSLVHRFDKRGNYLGSLSGERGHAGRFACPHGIAFRFDARDDGGPELYVADRGNARVQVFDAEGAFKRVVGARTLHSPCMFDFRDGLCLVPELFGRVDLLDENDELVAMLGDNGFATQQPGWPNHNITGHPERIQPCRFNSPHGACFGPDGSIYVAEWIVGGRVTRLERQG